MPEKLILNVNEAARLLGLSRSQLYNLTRLRSQLRQEVRLPFLRVGKGIAFRRESLEQWAAQNEQAQTSRYAGAAR